METIVAYVGFFLAAYSVISNDVIQTLGTFISSNKKRPWFFLWFFIGSILALTLIYGWYVNQGDVTYGRLDNIPLPEEMSWVYLLAPFSLLIITRYGIPVSTTFMILSVFSTGQVIEKMILKSIFGYSISFVAAFTLYLAISRFFESKAAMRLMGIKNSQNFWVVAQWLSTALLWSQWLVQDFANIYVFLPRQLNGVTLLITLTVILFILAIILRNRGGTIQKIVTSKTNTANIRSATVIDLSYAVLLFVFSSMSAIPMSTTWAFIGILAGREIAINYRLKYNPMKSTYKEIFKDLGKVNIGLIVSVLIAFLIKALK